MTNDLETISIDTPEITISDDLRLINIVGDKDAPLFTLAAPGIVSEEVIPAAVDALYACIGKTSDTSIFVSPDVGAIYESFDIGNPNPVLPIKTTLYDSSGNPSIEYSAQVVWVADRLVVTSITTKSLARNKKLTPEDIISATDKIGSIFETDVSSVVTGDIGKTLRAEYDAKLVAADKLVQQDELVRNESVVRATALYDNFYKLLHEVGKFEEFHLDADLFDNPDFLIAKSKENTLKRLAEYFEKNGLDFANFIASPNFINFLHAFIKNVVVAHNANSFFDPDNYSYTAGPHDDFLRKAFGVKQPLPYLSAVLLDPTTEYAKQNGTGWSGDTLYTFDIEEYAHRSLVGYGDIDASYSAYRDYNVEEWRDMVMVVPDAVLFAALNQLKLNELVETNVTSEIPSVYDEVILFGQHNLSSKAHRVVLRRKGVPADTP